MPVRTALDAVLRCELETEITADIANAHARPVVGLLPQRVLVSQWSCLHRHLQFDRMCGNPSLAVYRIVQPTGCPEAEQFLMRA